MEKKSEIEFDLMELLYHLRTKILIILISAVVLAAVGYVYTASTAVTRYTASTSLYVYRQEEQLSYNGLQEATQLRRDCEILIKGLNVSEEVVKRLELQKSAGAISGGITITSNDNTRIIQVNYTDTDARKAVLIANTIREVAIEQIESIMNIDVAKTVYVAKSASADAGRSPATAAVLAGLLGMFLSAGVFVVIFLLDDAVRTEEDVERYLGLSTLAAIPVSSELESATTPAEAKRPVRGILPKRKK